MDGDPGEVQLVNQLRGVGQLLGRQHEHLVHPLPADEFRRGFQRCHHRDSGDFLTGQVRIQNGQPYNPIAAGAVRLNPLHCFPGGGAAGDDEQGVGILFGQAAAQNPFPQQPDGVGNANVQHAHNQEGGS